MAKIPDILAKIIAYKQQEVAKRKQQVSEANLIVATTHTPYNFIQALQQCHLQQRPAIIAEIKKASPSKGIIRADFNPEKLALEYVAGGATCISVLTDEKFFQGSNQDLIQVRKCCKLPLLRKDFIIDSYQLYEARALGADCILLIVAALNDQQLHELHDLAIKLQLQVLVESHNLAELQRALTLPTPLIGINNRNLHTFETNLNTTIELQTMIPPDRLIITESGINTPEQIKLMQQHGINCFLIGEVLMQAPHPQQKLQEFMVGN